MSAADEQLRWALKYIRERYGHLVTQQAWYERGGWLPSGLSGVRNDTGIPEPVRRQP